MISKKILDICRWVALLPAVCLSWAIGVLIQSPVVRYVWIDSIGFVAGYFFVVPSVFMFFVARFIAPKYKTIAGLSAIVLCVFWVSILMYGLMNLAG